MNNNTETPKVKVCSKCKVKKPMNLKYFHVYKRNSDGFRGTCKECRNEYNRNYKKQNKINVKEYNERYRRENKEVAEKWRLTNKRKIHQYNARYYIENKEEITHQTRSYYEKNRDAILEKGKEYRSRNKDHYSAYNKKYRKKHKEHYNKYFKRYYKENPQVFKRARHRRLSKEKESLQTFTNEQWECVKSHFGNSCSYCGMTESEHKSAFDEVLHQDHFVPLSTGGDYTHDNIVPACRSCNCSKGNKSFFKWYLTHEHYSEKREKKILEFLNYTDEGIQQLSIL